jgi:ADP-heptose:LPS heptosyltransferase
VSHVLIARLDNDGDVLLAGPAVRAAAAHGTRVTLLVGPRGRAAGALLPGADGLLVHRAPWIDPDPGPVRREAVESLVADVAAAAPDVAVILTSFHQSPLPLALLLRLAGVGRIAAISTDYPGSLLDVRAADPGDVHEVRRSLTLMRDAGMPPAPADDDALRVLRPAGRPAGLPPEYVVVHPGASVTARAWEPARHRALVAELRRRGHAVVVTGGPGEARLTAEVAAGAPGAVDLGGRTTLAELAEVLAGSSVVVVGNTGPAHLAAAVGRPVAWLHAPTVPEARWHPWRVPYVRLGGLPACAGCRARECPVPGHPCLAQVGHHEVADAVDALAARPAPVREAVCAS